ncbi:unknown [Bacteroides sp. CAG:545]|nr:unknown [Bacteroides sp. CAG:545]
MPSLSVNRWGFTDKLFKINNLSGRRRVFTDKTTFCETTIIRNIRGAHKKNAVCHEE